MEQYKYDIAISLTEKDLQLAKLIKSLLPAYKIFLYSDEQTRLVGKDGDVEFSTVFEKESRFVIILHRNNWGRTHFTQVEKDAIQNRTFDQVYEEFCLLVSMEGKDKAAIPTFIPKRIIYHNYSELGIVPLLAVIENIFHRLGGEVKEETSLDIAKNIRANSDYQQKRKELHLSTEGLLLGIKEAEELFSEVKTLSDALINDVPHTLELHEENQIIVRSHFYQMNISWNHYQDLEENELHVSFRKRKGGNIRSEMEVYKNLYYKIDFDHSMNPCWVLKAKAQEFLYSKKFADMLMKEFLKQILGDKTSRKVHAINITG